MPMSLKKVGKVAALLATSHVENDEGTTKVYWSPHAKEVRLVEVSTSVEDRKEVLPFRFGTQGEEVPYESVVILLSPGDWKRVLSKKLKLPDGFEGLQVLKGDADANAP